MEIGDGDGEGVIGDGGEIGMETMGKGRRRRRRPLW